jgi:type IV secretion system protein VirB8
MFFKKKKEDKTVAATKNWYEDRYQTVVVQRNFLIIIILICLGAIIVSTMGVVKVSSSKKIEPFVIEIEEKTGVTNVIRPFLREKMTKDEAIIKYMVYKYVVAREQYIKSTHRYDYYTTVRLLSDSKEYARFRRALRSDGGPESLKNRGSRREVTVISIDDRSYLNKGQGLTYLVKFKTDMTASRGKHITEMYEAIVDFTITDMEMTLAQRAVNPVGFKVEGYTVNPLYLDTSDN